MFEKMTDLFSAEGRAYWIARFTNKSVPVFGYVFG